MPVSWNADLIADEYLQVTLTDRQREPEQIRDEVISSVPVTVGSVAILEKIRPEWERNAECKDEDPNIFHPTKYESSKAAKKICRACVVIDDCLEYSLKKKDYIGIKGGLTGNERRKLVRERKKTNLELIKD
jgi:WhiB family transcriptional regulator, redox-sensing transcriptional regulator